MRILQQDILHSFCLKIPIYMFHNLIHHVTHSPFGVSRNSLLEQLFAEIRTSNSKTVLSMNDNLELEDLDNKAASLIPSLPLHPGQQSIALSQRRLNMVFLLYSLLLIKYTCSIQVHVSSSCNLYLCLGVHFSLECHFCNCTYRIVY